MFRNSFDKTLENATSHLHLEPDWASMMILCDQIRQNDVTPKYALAALKKKMFHANPHSAYYALLALESIVKNCGQPVHEEVTTKASCEMFSQLINTTTHENVKNKMLELIQTWAHAFRANYKYCAIKDQMNILKCEGHKFPELKEADAMFVADVAPEWVDGDVCHRCRVAFGLMQRKHHCRNCGQVFCQQCSSKSSRLPKFGYEKEVRVCEACFIQIQKPVNAPSKKPTEDELPEEYLKSSLAQQSQAPPTKSEQEIQEEEELQLALALSQSEAEQKAKAAAAYNIPRSYPKSPSPEPVVQPKRSPSPAEQTDPELAKYLNRSYWEQRQQAKESPLSPTAPSPMSSIAGGIPMKYATEDPEIDDLVVIMRGQLDVFVNRMKSNSARGRDISNDTAIQSFFLSISSLHSKLLGYIKEMDDKRMWYESLQDKIAQIRDSRAALDVLRQEHQEKLRRAAEEAERLRQIQMAQKLEIMRKKKQEYLQYQRQLAFQRIQEQEREMQLRQEQQKARYQMGGAFTPYAAMGQEASPMMSGQFQNFNYPPAPGTQSPQVYGNHQNFTFSNYPGQTQPGMIPNGQQGQQQQQQQQVNGQQQFQPGPGQPPQQQQGYQQPPLNLQPPGQNFPPGMVPQGAPVHEQQQGPPHSMPPHPMSQGIPQGTMAGGQGPTHPMPPGQVQQGIPHAMPSGPPMTVPQPVAQQQPPIQVQAPPPEAPKEADVGELICFD